MLRKRKNNGKKPSPLYSRKGVRGAWVADVPASGIRPPADPKGPPLILFEKSIFGQPTLKFF